MKKLTPGILKHTKHVISQICLKVYTNMRLLTHWQSIEDVNPNRWFLPLRVCTIMRCLTNQQKCFKTSKWREKHLPGISEKHYKPKCIAKLVISQIRLKVYTIMRLLSNHIYWYCFLFKTSQALFKYLTENLNLLWCWKQFSIFFAIFWKFLN